MTTPKKHYSPSFKSQVVQEVLAANRTLTQIASEHGIHPNVITKWKRAALAALPDAFDERTDKQIAALIERYVACNRRGLPPRCTIMNQRN